MPTSIFIIGTPRSGTTICAGMLHLCGAPAFPSIDKALNGNQPTEWSPHGDYCDKDFFRLVDQLLPELSYPSESYTPSAEVLAMIPSLLADRDGNSPIWLVKGLVAWQGARVLAGIPGRDVRIIRTTRTLEHSQASFHDRLTESLKPKAYDYIAEIKRQSDAFYDAFAGPKITIEFERMFSDTKSVVNELAAFAGVSPTAEAVAFVDADARRYG
jgi:hypothetical protein